MKKAASFILLVCLLLGCLPPALAGAVELVLSAGEIYRIPEGRRGVFTADDETVASVTEDSITALRPGRTVIRSAETGEPAFSLLVLFGAAEAPVFPEPAAPDEAPAQPEPPAGDGEPEVSLTAPEPSPAPRETASPAPQAEATPSPAPAAPSPEPEAPSGPAYQGYDREAVPALINAAVDLAFTQWEEDAERGTKKFSRQGKYNKYSYWQCGAGGGCNIGWCGAFLGYVFDNAGVPMDAPTASVPHEDGSPWSVHAAGVGKINIGFSRMDRLTMVPRPGYLVIYGQQKGYGYKHIGLVADVDDLGGGLYLIKTVEGNMSSTIRRYCYLFDSNEKVKNLKPCPAEYVRDDAGINAYEHVSNWNITTFCQTWF